MGKIRRGLLVLILGGLLACGGLLAPQASEAAPLETHDDDDCYDNSVIRSYYYPINGGSTRYYDLDGKARAGDTVKVVFTARSGCSDVRVSLVSYSGHNEVHLQFPPSTLNVRTRTVSYLVRCPV